MTRLGAAWRASRFSRAALSSAATCRDEIHIYMFHVLFAPASLVVACKHILKETGDAWNCPGIAEVRKATARLRHRDVCCDEGLHFLLTPTISPSPSLLPRRCPAQCPA